MRHGTTAYSIEDFIIQFKKNYACLKKLVESKNEGLCAKKRDNG